MAGDQWLLLVAAADFIGTPDAQRIVNLAWILRKQHGFRFSGVRVGESEPAEIPFSEIGPIDCESSRIGDGMSATWRDVMMRWEDVKRLAQADVQRLLAQEAETPGGAKISTNEAGRRGGKKSAKTKRANMEWLPRALAIGRARYESRPPASDESRPLASYASVARAIVKDCQSAGVTCPTVERVAAWVSDQRKPGGEFPE
jgi:hypothetical protein